VLDALPRIFVMTLRVLALSMLFLHAGARRSLRVDDSHRDSQQQSDSVVHALQVSAEAQQTFNPMKAFTTRHAHGARHGLSGPKQDQLLRKADRMARPVMQVPDIAAPPMYSPVQGSSPPRPRTPAADAPILVQGGSLRTWSFRSPAVEQVQVVLSTDGRPLDADLELWHGPDNTPVKMRVYVENGQLRPFSTVIETPRGPNTVAIRNIGQIEFPIQALVAADNVDNPSPECTSSSMTIQGGALRTFPFEPRVDSVEVLIRTDGRPLNARVELLQGPNNNKQVIELYTEDGLDRPVFFILETPGSGNVVRIVNTSPVEFPMAASVVPHSMNDEMYSDAVLGGDVVIGGDVGW